MIRMLPLVAIASVKTAAARAERHIELVKSVPTASEVLTAPPGELMLTFSTDLDYERTAVTLRGPAGSIELSDPRRTDDQKLLAVDIEGELSEGSYTVSWTAAPLDDHSGRGRYDFTVTGGGEAGR